MKDAAVLVMTILGATSGCSWLFVQPLHSGGGSASNATCTANRAAPVADTLVTVGAFASTIYVSSRTNYDGQGLTVMAGATTTTLFLLSMMGGYWDTSACQDATRSLPSPTPGRRPTGQLQVTHRPIPAEVSPAPAAPAASEEEQVGGDAPPEGRVLPR